MALFRFTFGLFLKAQGKGLECSCEINSRYKVEALGPFFPFGAGIPSMLCSKNRKQRAGLVLGSSAM